MLNIVTLSEAEEDEDRSVPYSDVDSGGVFRRRCRRFFSSFKLELGPELEFELELKLEFELELKLELELCGYLRVIKFRPLDSSTTEDEDDDSSP